MNPTSWFNIMTKENQQVVDDKERIKILKELATGILSWIEKNEKAIEDTEVVPWEEARERLMKLD